MFLDNKNIFQICIGLNDDIDSLKKSREKLISLNSEYRYCYINSQELFDELTIKEFKNSDDEFEQKIYECFISVDSVLKISEKARRCQDEETRKEIYRICALVSKTDIFRLAMLYKYGGLYFDLSKSFELDIDKEFSMYDIVLIRSSAEIHTSLIYAKKHNPIIKKLLQDIIQTCVIDKRKSSNVSLAGPGLYTRTIKSMFRDFDLESIGDFPLSSYNGIIFYNEKPITYLRFNTEWRNQLHQPDPKNEKLIPNRHWLYNDL